MRSSAIVARLPTATRTLFRICFQRSYGEHAPSRQCRDSLDKARPPSSLSTPLTYRSPRIAISLSRSIQLFKGGPLRRDLKLANLILANLTLANLTGADLSNANLSSANLTDANLTDANLKLANLTLANLTGADLTGATSPAPS